MSPELAPYIIVLWLIAVVLAFPSMVPHRGILMIYLSGTLFLPEAVPGVLEFGPIKLSKIPAMNYAALLATALFHWRNISRVMPTLFDLPLIVWCMIPIPSVLTNEPPPDGSLPLRDALSQTFANIVLWGIPYLIGRWYFTNPRAMRDLAVSFLLGAAIYLPLCWFEMRMSPQLHNYVYGYSQHEFIHTVRFGGYRPMVFMQHGLLLSLFMSFACLIGIWLWMNKTLVDGSAQSKVNSMYFGYFLLFLLPTTLFLKSTGAVIISLVGFGTLVASFVLKSRIGLLLLVCVPVIYATTRTTGAWSGQNLVRLTEEWIAKERAQSLEARLGNEDALIGKALKQPLFGWGGWGRNRIKDEWGKDITLADGLWVIVLGDRGIVGLLALGSALLLPVLRFSFVIPPKEWASREAAVAAVCAFVLVLWVIDELFNGMVIPHYILIAGALAGLKRDEWLKPQSDDVESATASSIH